MKDNMPLVSIILLTYNHAQYIEDNILGLLEQDYSNVELIILDDASRDRTVEIIKCYHKELIEKFKRVEFFENKTNSGNIPYNINCMLKKTYGKYCKLISGDDIMASNCISKLVKWIILNVQLHIQTNILLKITIKKEIVLSVQTSFIFIENQRLKMRTCLEN